MSVTYDVYVKERGRWLLECEFRWDEREAALEKAQSLAKRHYVQAVKVIRERYDKVTQRVTESTVFDTSDSGAAEGNGRSMPARRKTSSEPVQRPSLAELDIWTEDGDPGLHLDRAECRNSAKSAAILPRGGPIQRLITRMLAAFVMGIGLQGLMASTNFGALPPIL